MRSQRARVLMCIACVTLLVRTMGCWSQDAGPSRAAVTGRLTLAGQPVAGAHVHFVNLVYPGDGTFAITDAGGKFRLTLGAAVGLNVVYFSKFEGGNVALNSKAGIDAGQMQAMAAASERSKKKPEAPRQVIPLEYSTLRSKLKFLVPTEGVAAANFDLGAHAGEFRPWLPSNQQRA